MEPVFFISGAEVAAWLEAHGDSARELLAGFYKKGAPRTCVSYQDALDAALCSGWIDGVRKRLDASRYTIRFTPRKRGSIWSAVNIARAGELRALDRMRPAGLAAFEGRDLRQAGLYSYEQDQRDLSADYVAQFQAAPAAWAYFEAQPPSYHRTASWWVMSAKQEVIRARRLAKLVQCSADGKRLAEVVSPRQREDS